MSMAAALGDGVDHFNMGLKFGEDCSTFPFSMGQPERSNCPDFNSPEPLVMGNDQNSAENFVFDHHTCCLCAEECDTSRACAEADLAIH